jgi:nucleotide-binding universal stress UspA family protein
MKFDHILFPVDFSEHAGMLNSEVEWLASHFGSRVTLLHVFEVPASWYGGGDAPLMSAEDIKAYSEWHRQRLEQYSIQLPEDRIRRISAEGSPDWHIAQCARENRVDLIVMGTHGYGVLRRLLLGSTAMKVLHDVSCPVWMHSSATKLRTPIRGVSHIVCSIELTEEALPLLRFARDLANEFNAEVRLVHTVPAMDSRPETYLDLDLTGFLKDSAREEISKLQSEAGTEFPLSVTEGNLSQDIAEAALSEHADLVVIGRGKSQQMFGTLRSHTYGVIRQAPCPVLSYSMEFAADLSETTTVPGESRASEKAVPDTLD